MAVNKVEYGGQTLVDLTADTVTVETLIAGTTAHNAAGEQISGTFDPSKYDALIASKLSAANPTGTGAFSLNREADTVVGNYSFAEGYSGKASGTASHAEGYDTEAGGHSSHAEGCRTAATGDFSHAEGYETVATGDFSHVHGCKTTATQNSQFVVGYGNDNQTDSVFEVGNGLKGDGTAATDGSTVSIKQNAFRVTKSGQAIAQTGLGIGGTVITEAQLRNALCLDEVMRMSGSLYMQHSTPVEAAAYNTAGVVALAVNPTVTDGTITAAAGYGFHNAGYDGVFLYLSPTDRTLRTIDDLGSNVLRLGGDNILMVSNKYLEVRAELGIKSHNGAGTAWTPIYASAFAQQSSRKYKDNIADLKDEDALKLLDLRPVKYDYINIQNGLGCYGLIAEEVAEVMTYPVVYDADGNPDGLDYSKFVPYLIKMAQLHQTRISELERENQNLKERLDKIEERLNSAGAQSDIQ